jgi:outer membrane murein-binding lipoprotein Lpp
MKRLVVAALIASSILLSGCGLKVSFGGTGDAACNILCSGTL